MSILITSLRNWSYEIGRNENGRLIKNWSFGMNYGIRVRDLLH